MKSTQSTFSKCAIILHMQTSHSTPRLQYTQDKGHISHYKVTIADRPIPGPNIVYTTWPQNQRSMSCAHIVYCVVIVNKGTLCPSSGKSPVTTKARERPTAPLRPPHVMKSTVLPEKPYPKCVRMGFSPSILTSLKSSQILFKNKVLVATLLH